MKITKKFLNTTMKSVNIGLNKYCGPAVLSILTGKSTDECAYVISQINGQYNVAGVNINDLLRAADRLGFDQRKIDIEGSLFRALTHLAVKEEGMFIVMIPKHFVCIEIKDKKIYFCDSHTKEPIPAASSARLMQQVISIYKVSKRPIIEVEPSYSSIEVIQCDYCTATARGNNGDRVIHYNNCKYKIYLSLKG